MNNARRAGIAFLLLVAGVACSHGPQPPASSVTIVSSSVPSNAKAFEGPLREFHIASRVIGFRRFGTGPPLLLLNGDDAAMSIWPAYFLAPLAKTFTVTIVDYPGIGVSTDDTSAAMTIPGLADQIAEFITATSPQRPVVLGWSFGAEIAITLAVRHPDSLRALITSGGDAGGPRAVQANANVLRSMRDANASPAVLLDLLFPRSAIDARAASITDYLSSPQESASSSTRLRQTAAEDSFASDPAVFDHLGDIRVPTLIMQGSVDVIVPAVNARIIAREIPGAKLLMFANAGHGMLFQDVARVVQAVRAFTAG